MTLSGCVQKTFLLFGLLLLSSAWVWNQFYVRGGYDAVLPFMMTGLIGGFVIALITVFKKPWSPITAPIYAILEGLAIGGISAGLEELFPGIVAHAVGLTFGTLFSLLLAYKSGLIKPTQNFKLAITAATGAICILYAVDLVLQFGFNRNISFIHESGTRGILFSLFVVVMAALNLVMDFDFIENGAKSGAPKYMEWYGSFGLMVTLVWLYLEILRLLVKSRRR